MSDCVRLKKSQLEPYWGPIVDIFQSQYNRDWFRLDWFNCIGKKVALYSIRKVPAEILKFQPTPQHVFLNYFFRNILVFKSVIKTIIWQVFVSYYFLLFKIWFIEKWPKTAGIGWSNKSEVVRGLQKFWFNALLYKQKSFC